MVSFIEYLTLRAWCLSILPRLLWRRIRQGDRVIRCYVFESSLVALRAARVLGRMAGIPVELLHFRLMDVRDTDGLWVRLRVPYQDLAEVQAGILNDPVFREVLREGRLPGRSSTYLAKSLTTIGLSERGTLWRVLLTIQVCAWKLENDHPTEASAVLFLERQPWIRVIARYASKYRLAIVQTLRPVDPKTWLRHRLSPELLAWARSLNAHRRSRSLASLLRVRSNGGSWSTRRAGCRTGSQPGPQLAVEYYGHLNLKQPERYSDLFFWQRSSISGRDIVVTFTLPKDPINEQKWFELTGQDMRAVALDPQATTISETPVFTYRPPLRASRGKRIRLSVSGRSPETRWFREHLVEYQLSRDYWTELLRTYGIKIYLTWFKYDATHYAIADALQSLGGVTAIYQRAYEGLPSVETAINADIVFGFSQIGTEVERRSNSIIPYHVTTGYLGDHRFALLQQQAEARREILRRRGAMRMLAFSDENSHDDERWHPGHVMTRENYTFLLEKVLSEPWLGLLIKPKVPSTLRRRLGPVAKLLECAEATGRCFVYEGGALHGSYPPAAAALAADVMIHGHLCAATAGVEAALAGVPTLLLDREEWSVSPLYRLGVGRVVFTDWPTLWKACVEHWTRPGGVPGFGDWSSLLDELDPFRDGRAAERMGTYLRWLLDGLKAGLHRETVMADAAERYARRWGKDKITHVNAHPERAHEPSEGLVPDDEAPSFVERSSGR